MIEDGHHDQRWEDLEDNHQHLHAHLTDKAVDGVDTMDPVPGEDTRLQLCHNKVWSESQGQEVESYRDHTRQHAHVSL